MGGVHFLVLQDGEEEQQRIGQTRFTSTSRRPGNRHYRVINPDQPVKTPHSFQLGSTWSAQVLGGNAQVSYRLVLFIF
ncbi:hypothetical protein OUZ56_008737 [Daphnia magna]|uniref:Uncharacterized protein n=1 Tax=Daphnia magna TaxID=35525 RepID=A0ABR0AE95_9CRUS|nr:hypothetical protein OUZ56_008737 [Daphnia magna]